MSDTESIKKILRAVLQSSKTGVPLSRLQSDYRSLSGEFIPLGKLGFSKLEDFLRSIPSVVRLENSMGQLRCFAVVCDDTAGIAQLVARQRSSKKSGSSQVVNCKMRYKPFNPYMVNVTPRSSLRQPSAGKYSNWTADRSAPRSGCSASGDYRLLDRNLSLITPVEHRAPSLPPAAKKDFSTNRGGNSAVNPVNKIPRADPPTEETVPLSSQDTEVALDPYDVEMVQSRVKQLLESCPYGVWMSKLPSKYNEMFCQKLHPQALVDLERWPHVCMVEKACITNHSDRLIYPPLPSKSPTSPANCTSSSSGSSSSNQHSGMLPPLTAKAPAGKVLPSVTLRSPAPNPALPSRLPHCTVSAKDNCERSILPTDTPCRKTRSLAPTWPASTSSASSLLQADQDVLPLLKATFSSPSTSAPTSPLKPCPVALSDEVRQKLKDLLSKCSQGLWADALPKCFMDVYKMPFPEEILDNLSVLCGVCTVEYPFPQNKKKAILYNFCQDDMSVTNSQQTRNNPLPSGLETLGPVVPPPLTHPTEHCPSVLVTEANNTTAITIRYVGDNYSNAQKTMEDMMQTFYSQNSRRHPVSNPEVGQLVAVKVEDGDEMARAQVMEVMTSNMVKVFYTDYGFSVETSRDTLLQLHRDFLSLPFQATNVSLAGLEAVSSHPKVLSTLGSVAIEKILRMETLRPCQQNEMPTVVLYDTSQDEDVNINSMCLKVLQDDTMNNPLRENVVYKDVQVSSVCADGSIFCQLPSRGTVRLTKLLEGMEAFFASQITSESLVFRPFSGMFCVASYKGQWARAEITYVRDNRVLDILFIDLGIPATVIFMDVRGVPRHFLKDFVIIPPQAIKCRLADLPIPEEGWSHEDLLLLKETVVGAKELKMKISKVEEYKGEKVIFMHLFDGHSQELHQSLNHQLREKVLSRDKNAIPASDGNAVDTDLTALMERLNLSSPVLNPIINALPVLQGEGVAMAPGVQPLMLPPPLDLPQPGQNMDVFVPVACHPGYFVVQPWQDLHKLVVLMGEMALYYNQSRSISKMPPIQKGHVYAAKFDKNWHRVQVKGILTNGLVSIYDLDYGKHELVPRTLIQPLIEEFRQLPFQAITAQLAGVTQRQWSEEAAVMFRSHVEKRALVAQVESVQDVSEAESELSERRLTLYLVDTSFEEDVWIHNLMTYISG
ncbi:tudor domain-containing protein 7A [Cyprinodon tularosa]|uniref:tudor domain-containing protein 7A n=1 Tax=Cyprinodon tularosa TaxID=77115 RepID=UPI0018E21B13|nr:tudor domain-containing protein 7A [Cyprinodon tularosa]